ncbi:MAG TPA: TauD/TfdA family dioxygenase [Alphaproteobacteria bacterium]|nr:TauD/TfdA family dioxygenase [Alphaproteobacteria bacterium]
MTFRFDIRPTAGPLGADVVGFPFRDFSDRDIAAMRKAWLDHQVLRFRDTDIDDDIQIRFSATLGPFVIHPRQAQEGQHGSRKEILVVSNMKKPDGTPAGDLGDGEVQWHTDTWFKERPPSASILRALKIPPAGGNTYFSSMYRAYETLPAALKTAIEGRCIHHQTVIDGRGDLRMGMTRPESDDVRTWPGVDHPIVRTHGETGRRALYLGGSPKYQSIVGMPLDEGRAILDELWRHAGRAEFVWTQVWRSGDMVMWDNRCVMHKRDAFESSSVRLMHRTAIEGERPH